MSCKFLSEQKQISEVTLIESSSIMLGVRNSPIRLCLSITLNNTWKSKWYPLWAIMTAWWLGNCAFLKKFINLERPVFGLGRQVFVFYILRQHFSAITIVVRYAMNPCRRCSLIIHNLLNQLCCFFLGNEDALVVIYQKRVFDIASQTNYLFN